MTDDNDRFPRTRIGIVRKIWQYALRVLHFSAFHSVIFCISIFFQLCGKRLLAQKIILHHIKQSMTKSLKINGRKRR